MTNSMLLFFSQFVFFKYEEKVGHPILSVVDILQRSDESFLTYSGSLSGKKKKKKELWLLFKAQVLLQGKEGERQELELAEEELNVTVYLDFFFKEENFAAALRRWRRSITHISSTLVRGQISALLSLTPGGN